MVTGPDYITGQILAGGRRTAYSNAVVQPSVTGVAPAGQRTPLRPARFAS